jgi:hypothetical protein
MPSYYAIGLSASNVNTAAYYQLDPANTLSILQGGFACSVALYPQ